MSSAPAACPPRTDWPSRKIIADKQSNLMIFGGLGIFVVGFIAMAAVMAAKPWVDGGAMGAPLGLALLYAILGVALRFVPTAEFGGDHVRTRLGKHDFLYAEVIGYNVEKRRIQLRYRPADEQETRTVRIDTSGLGADNKSTLLALLEERTGLAPGESRESPTASPSAV